MLSLREKFRQQELENGYELVNGIEMHAEHGDRFQIPHAVLKKHVLPGHFVEVRIDSPRFSAHPDAPLNCTCPHCNEEATKPILSHEHPATLLPLPEQNVPARGWGEDFWVEITVREGDYFAGRVDNPLYEAKLHGLGLDDELVLHAGHILAVHAIHREEMVLGMDAADLKELARWLGTQDD